MIREAREEDAEGIAQAFVDSLRSAHKEHLPADASIMQFSYEESERNWARSLSEIRAEVDSEKCIYVVEEAGGLIVGVAMGGPERSGHPTYTGEVYVIYLLPDHQRQGLGRAMMEIIARHLTQHGMDSLLVSVLGANLPARRFYEGLSGQLVSEKQVEEDGTLLHYVAYGWQNMRLLVSNCDA